MTTKEVSCLGFFEQSRAPRTLIPPELLELLRARYSHEEILSLGLGVALAFLLWRKGSGKDDDKTPRHILERFLDVREFEWQN